MSETNEQFDPGEEVEESHEQDAIRWKASEYVHHEKDAAWHAVFIIATLIVMALLYLILQDILSLVVVGLMAVSLLVFANRPPRTLAYSVDDRGVDINGNKYSYDSFRSFSIVEDSAFHSIVLNPLQRLMPPITLYFPPEEGEKIVDVIGSRLPHMEYEPNVIDRFAQRVRF